LLFYKIEVAYWPVIKSFMLFLNRLPESLNNDIDDFCLKELDLI